MNLILQAATSALPIAPDLLPTIHRIADMAGAERIAAIHSHAYRLENIAYTAALKEEVDALCMEAKLDAHFLAKTYRLSDFKLLAMDMDSTLITIECIDEIADMQGLKPQVAAITEAAMRGEIDFRTSLNQRVALLKGLDAAALQRVYDERLGLSPGAETMLKAVQQAGLQTLLVSGGFTFFTDRIKTRLNLNHTHANVLEIIDGKLSGRVLGDIVDAEEKKNTVLRTCAKLGIAPEQTIVMGDGANDLAMMSIAGLSVAFRAKPVVRAQADVAFNFVGLDGLAALFA